MNINTNNLESITEENQSLSAAEQEGYYAYAKVAFILKRVGPSGSCQTK